MTDLSALETFKKCVLDPEREDAAKRLADPGYWGDTGKAVLRAIGYVEVAIDKTPYERFTDLSEWLERVQRAVETAHGRYREDEEDEDGYGSATFHACLRRISEFREYVSGPAAG
jgi:hypothetical protein